MSQPVRLVQGNHSLTEWMKTTRPHKDGRYSSYALNPNAPAEHKLDGWLYAKLPLSATAAELLEAGSRDGLVPFSVRRYYGAFEVESRRLIQATPSSPTLSRLPGDEPHDTTRFIPL